MLVVVVVQLLARDFLTKRFWNLHRLSFLVLDNISVHGGTRVQSNHLKRHHTALYYLAAHQGYLDSMRTVCRGCLQLMRR